MPKRPGVLIALLLFAALHHAVAQDTALDETRALRKDTQIATDALNKIDHGAERENIETAKNALERISQRLDARIAQLEAPADPYDGGNKYPPIAGVSIQNFDVPVGATIVHVPVTLDRPSPNTVVAHIRVFDGQGGRAHPDRTKAVIFRPGDPLVKTVSFDVREMKEGNTVRAVQPSVPDGGKRLGGGILVTAKADALNEPIEDAGRAALAFTPLGDLRYAVTGETIEFDDRGSPDRFSTALAHGRTQVGNGETGYYGTVEMGGFARTPEGLALSTRRLETPIQEGSPPVHYPFVAAMLSGHRTSDTHFKYGSVEWIVKMPNRRGSWPALWLLPTAGWPPEIDVYEGFGYNGSWKFNSDLSTNLHGGKNLVRKFTRPAMHMKMSSFGLADTLDSEFHTFGVTVEPEWITMFIDGVETMRYVNPFKGETWYPLTNVAVKADVSSPYTDGSGAMILRSLKVWRSE